MHNWEYKLVKLRRQEMELEVCKTKTKRATQTLLNYVMFKKRAGVFYWV